MKKISTPYSFSLKIFPIFFFGFLALFFGLMLMNGAYEKNPQFLVIPAVMGVIGYIVMKTTLRDLADEVFDCGDFLLVRKRGEEDRVPLANIINVNFSMNARPARITLTLAKPSKFGPEISFALPPRVYLSPFPRSEIAEDLIARAQVARSSHAV